jgi:Lon protease-like protein
VTLKPAFPLGTAFLPGDAVVLRVFESRYLEMMQVVLEGDRCFVSALIAGGSEVGGGDVRFNEGVLVEIDRIEEADIGLMLYGRATEAVNIAQWNDEAPYPQAQVENQQSSHSEVNTFTNDSDLLSHLANNLKDFFDFLESFDIPVPVAPEFVISLLPSQNQDLRGEDLWALFWSMARLLPSTPMSRCELLVDKPLATRIRRALEEIEHLRDIVRFRYGN